MRSERYGRKFVKLGLQIKKIREDKNLTQQNLADKVGIHLSYIGNIGLFAMFEARLKSFHRRPLGAYDGCVHFADHTPYAE
jgi:hypothetical protein